MGCGCEKGSPPVAAVGGTRSGVSCCSCVLLQIDPPAAASAFDQPAATPVALGVALRFAAADRGGDVAAIDEVGFAVGVMHEELALGRIPADH